MYPLFEGHFWGSSATPHMKRIFLSETYSEFMSVNAIVKSFRFFKTYQKVTGGGGDDGIGLNNLYYVLKSCCQPGGWGIL